MSENGSQDLINLVIVDGLVYKQVSFKCTHTTSPSPSHINSFSFWQGLHQNSHHVLLMMKLSLPDK